MYAVMIHRIFVSIIVVVVSCCKICDAFVVKSYLPSTNSLQKKHKSNRVNTSKLNVVNNNRGIELSNVFYDDTDMAFSAWEWQNGLGEICCVCECVMFTYTNCKYTLLCTYIKISLFFQSSRCTCGVNSWCSVSNINGNT